ncbi:alpha/beta fold hydrolase [Fusibacter sp. JL216-2]|uniref:alpha/beta fold hydrolase n=1 Tax=Fusibacter sp. JL216-2 TaxID=3071453 RepID=UPI003D329963
MSIKRIHVNKIEIWTQTYGDQKNEAVILIAGAMAPATFWEEEFCRALADNDFFVIRFDNRDFGYSTHFEESEVPPYTINDMVEDTKNILDFYEATKAHIIGHSLGGSVAQLFAVMYPERTVSLIPISSPIIAKGNLEFVNTDQKILNDLWNVLMSNRMYQDVERGKSEFLRIHKYLNGSYDVDIEMSYNYTSRIYETEVIKPHLNHTNIQNNVPDIFNELKKIEVPIMFLYGDKDYLASNIQNVKILDAHLPNSNLVVLEGAGHMFFNRSLWNSISKVVLDFIL